MTLRPEEFTRTSAFLRASHRDRVPVVEPVASQPVPEVKVSGRRQPVERQAGSESSLTVSPVNVPIVPGSEVKPTTPPGSTCQTCQQEARTRKEGRQFFAECQPCGTSELYFTNPA